MGINKWAFPKDRSSYPRSTKVSKRGILIRHAFVPEKYEGYLTGDIPLLTYLRPIKTMKFISIRITQLQALVANQVQGISQTCHNGKIKVLGKQVLAQH